MPIGLLYQFARKTLCYSARNEFFFGGNAIGNIAMTRWFGPLYTNSADLISFNKGCLIEARSDLLAKNGLSGLFHSDITLLQIVFCIDRQLLNDLVHG